MKNRIFGHKKRELRDLQERAREKLESLQESAREYYHEGRRKTEEWRESLSGFVQERPMISLLVVAGLGLCIGLALSATRRARVEEEMEPGSIEEVNG